MTRLEEGWHKGKTVNERESIKSNLLGTGGVSTGQLQQRLLSADRPPHMAVYGNKDSRFHSSFLTRCWIKCCLKAPFISLKANEPWWGASTLMSTCGLYVKKSDHCCSLYMIGFVNTTLEKWAHFFYSCSRPPCIFTALVESLFFSCLWGSAGAEQDTGALLFSYHCRCLDHQQTFYIWSIKVLCCRSVWAFWAFLL